MNRRDILREYFSSIGRKAVKARMKKVTPEDRSRIASSAAKARWAREKAKATGKGK
jgi:hypothetical protein